MGSGFWGLVVGSMVALSCGGEPAPLLATCDLRLVDDDCNGRAATIYANVVRESAIRFDALAGEIEAHCRVLAGSGEGASAGSIAEAAVAACGVAARMPAVQLVGAAASWPPVVCDLHETQLQCELGCNGGSPCNAHAPIDRCADDAVGTCSANCAGPCSDSADGVVECTGTCDGACNGFCDGVTMASGACSGFCQGACAGACTAPIATLAGCDGVCGAFCSVELASAKCSAPLVGPCEPCTRCLGACQTRARQAATCAQIGSVGLPVDASADPEVAVRLGEIRAACSTLGEQMQALGGMVEVYMEASGELPLACGIAFMHAFQEAGATSGTLAAACAELDDVIGPKR